MSIIKPNDNDQSADGCLAVAEDLFEQAVLGMNGLSKRIRREEIVPEKDTRAVAAILNSATFQLMKERDRVAELRRKSAGIVGDYAIDFDAARAEIGRRLACLREAGGG
ncbi:MAG: hypothetical protein LJE68_03935 [Rhodobacter sp.]|jgi:hypothetical protein|nr:hypothetical protein [Rhodobacter sp.]